MTLKEIFLGGSGALVVILTLIQISPIKVDPFGALARWIGRALNGDVMKKLDKMESAQVETRERLDEHIRVDDERNADLHRTYILRFSMELRRGMQHTDEDFNEILYNIKCYEQYCKDHPEYQNNRAVHAIKHIENMYDERMKQHDPE